MIFRINIASLFIASFIWLSLLFAKKHVNMTGCLSARLISEARQLSSSTPLKLDISNIRSLKLKFTNIKCSSNNCLILFSAQDVMARTMRQMTTHMLKIKVDILANVSRYLPYFSKQSPKYPC